MDMEDPIQQLLKNTGWSCEDLLAKLQQYKSVKESNKQEKQPEKAAKETEENDTPLSEECIVDSTEEITESDIPKVQNLEASSNLIRRKCKTINSSRQVAEDFSDTDEEEVEVNATNTNIINEIIDDISSAENSEGAADKSNLGSYQRTTDKGDTTEVTEVRVVEVNSDNEDNDNFEDDDDNFEEDDDDFEEDVPYKVSNATKKIDTETFPRQTFNTLDQSNQQKAENIVTTNKEKDGINKPNSKQSCLESPPDIPYKLYNSCHKTELNPKASCSSEGDCAEKSVSRTSSDSREVEAHLVKDRSKNVEDIRNNLKLQLSCLRTRKRTHFLEDLKTKITEMNKQQESTFTSQDSSHSSSTTFPSNSSIILNSTKKSEAESIRKIVAKKSVEDRHANNSLYTQTNEFGLVILNVQGGIDIDNVDTSCSNTTIPGNSFNENSSNTNDSVVENDPLSFNDSNTLPAEDNTYPGKEDIDPKGVFDEIRKIIRKQRDPTNLRNRKYGFSETGSEKAIDSSDLMNSVHSRKAKDSSFESATFSTENSLSSFTADDNDQATDKNSPFVSNTLDEFLTENSKLNISYKVPKSGAEDGLTDSYHEESPLILKKVVKVDQPIKPKTPKTEIIKAKTVAQKRKILEKQRLKEIKAQEKNKIRSDSKGDAEQKTRNGKENIGSRGKRNSFIMVNNEKIWVRSTSQMCIGKIVIKNPSPINLRTCSPTDNKQIPIKTSPKQKKFSLLNEMGRQHRPQVKYRPGPLSKKPSLQVDGQDNWTTERKMLPKIFLEVVPKIGQPIPLSVLSRLPQNDGRLTESRIEFALAVLKTSNPSDKHKIFKFPLAYNNNQEYILVRKQKTHLHNFSRRRSHSEQRTEDIVGDVIDDLIKYVEIKEMAPTLIKEEEKMEYEDEIMPLKDVKTKMPLISENVSSIFKKPQKKRSRIELELSRLSCKVVNVEVEESFTEEFCSKSYCRLGCVCKSLKCDRNLVYHCQKVECMLDCTCPKEKQVVYDKLTLPAGTDILSTDAVNRIEDEAKKDLAKVEREFTQTVIHTNDKTIVVGLGGRHKTRRATKAPKKYSDYIESFDAVKVEQKFEVPQSYNFFKDCVVNIERLNIPGIIPFCLIHYSYDCDCEEISSTRPSTCAAITKDCTDSSTKPVKSQLEKKKVVSSSHKKKSPKPPKRKHLDSKSSDDYNEAIVDSDSLSSSTDRDSTVGQTVTTGRPVRNIKKTKFHEDFSYSDELSFFLIGDCARVRGVPTHILSRKSASYSAKARSVFLKDDFTNNITDADILKANCSDKQQLLESALLKNQLVTEAQRNILLRSLNMDDSTSDKNMHKRKQTLEVRNDENNAKQGFNQDLAIQRRKKLNLLTKKSTNIESVFEGEIIIDKRNMELLRKMGPKTVAEGYARLLPWKALIESFKKGSIKIWCMVDQPSRLLVNKQNQLPPKNYIDIRQTNQTSEVVLWILSNQLPSSYHEDNVSFILKQTKYNYEICGLCTKNFTETVTSIDKTDEAETQQTDQILLPFKHKDLNGDQQMLYIQKSSFKLQELIEENLADIGETSIERSKLYMWAALPEIYKVCKWRMLFLNSDFTYLYFTKLKYSIKYTDLVGVNNMAKTENFTVALKNPLISNAYHHPEFGIYFDSHYQDRLFIGPYIKQFDGDDIQTLRYINKALVCTESFNKMQGKTNYKCGHWLIERPYTSKQIEAEPTAPTIDLTSDDDSNMFDRKRKSDCDINDIFKKPKYADRSNGKEEIVIVHKDVKIKVIDGMPRKPEDFNRYIITNIPHFGYLGAFQHSLSKELDVSWPFENKLLRFPTVNSATEFLQERFSSLLQPIPETFKINVIVLTFMDLKNSHPINASILTGHYICGDFGCYNVKTVTNDFCLDKLGMTREELLRVFAKRAQAFIRAKIEELAGLLYIPKSQLGCYDMVNILDMARKEVLEQKSLEKHNTSVKNDLLLQKRELALKVFNMISVLPEEQRHMENLRFREILRSRNLLQTTTLISETIEIPDSSDEEDNKADDDKVMPTLCDQSLPEPPRSSHLGMPTLSEQPLPNLSRSNLSNRKAKETFSILGQPESSRAQSEVLISILKEKSIPNKVAETTTLFQRQRPLKLKSILKPKLPNPPLPPGVEALGTASKEKISAPSKLDVGQSPFKNMPPPQFLPGVKIVKTSSGKLVLVSDKSPKKQVTSKAVGTKVIIKNNKILSIKSMSAINQSIPPISVLEQHPINSLNSVSDVGKTNQKAEVNTSQTESNTSSEKPLSDNSIGENNIYENVEKAVPKTVSNEMSNSTRDSEQKNHDDKNHSSSDEVDSSINRKTISDSSIDGNNIYENVEKSVPKTVSNEISKSPTNSIRDSEQKNHDKKDHSSSDEVGCSINSKPLSESSINENNIIKKVEKSVPKTISNEISKSPTNSTRDSEEKNHDEKDHSSNDEVGSSINSKTLSESSINANNIYENVEKPVPKTVSNEISKSPTNAANEQKNHDENDYQTRKKNGDDIEQDLTTVTGHNFEDHKTSNINRKSDTTLMNKTDPSGNCSAGGDIEQSKINEECSSSVNDETSPNNTEISTCNVTTEMEKLNRNIESNISQNVTENISNSYATLEENVNSKSDDDDKSSIDGSQKSIIEQNKDVTLYEANKSVTKTETTIKTDLAEGDWTHPEINNTEVEAKDDKTKYDSKSSDIILKVSDENDKHCPEIQTISVEETTNKSLIKIGNIAKDNEESSTEANFNNNECSHIGDHTSTEIVKTDLSNNCSISDNQNEMLRGNIQVENREIKSNGDDTINITDYSRGKNSVENDKNDSEIAIIDTEPSKIYNVLNENDIPVTVEKASDKNYCINMYKTCSNDNGEREIKIETNPCGNNVIQGTGDCITIDKISFNPSNKSPTGENLMINSNNDNKTENSVDSDSNNFNNEKTCTDQKSLDNVNSIRNLMTNTNNGDSGDETNFNNNSSNISEKLTGGVNTENSVADSNNGQKTKDSVHPETNETDFNADSTNTNEKSIVGINYISNIEMDSKNADAEDADHLGIDKTFSSDSIDSNNGDKTEDSLHLEEDKTNCSDDSTNTNEKSIGGVNYVKNLGMDSNNGDRTEYSINPVEDESVNDKTDTNKMSVAVVTLTIDRNNDDRIEKIGDNINTDEKSTAGVNYIRNLGTDSYDSDRTDESIHETDGINEKATDSNNDIENLVMDSNIGHRTDDAIQPKNDESFDEDIIDTHKNSTVGVNHVGILSTDSDIGGKTDDTVHPKGDETNLKDESSSINEKFTDSVNYNKNPVVDSKNGDRTEDSVHPENEETNFNDDRTKTKNKSMDIDNYISNSSDRTEDAAVHTEDKIFDDNSTDTNENSAAGIDDIRNPAVNNNIVNKTEDLILPVSDETNFDGATTNTREKLTVIRTEMNSNNHIIENSVNDENRKINFSDDSTKTNERPTDGVNYIINLATDSDNRGRSEDSAHPENDKSINDVDDLVEKSTSGVNCVKDASVDSNNSNRTEASIHPQNYATDLNDKITNKYDKSIDGVNCITHLVVNSNNDDKSEDSVNSKISGSINDNSTDTNEKSTPGVDCVKNLATDSINSDNTEDSIHLDRTSDRTDFNDDRTNKSTDGVYYTSNLVMDSNNSDTTETSVHFQNSENCNVTNENSTASVNIVGNLAIDSDNGEGIKDCVHPESDETNFSDNSTVPNEKSTVGVGCISDSSSSDNNEACSHERENACDNYSDNVSKEVRNSVDSTAQAKKVIEQFVGS